MRAVRYGACVMQDPPRRGFSPDEVRHLYAQFAPTVFRRAKVLLAREADAWDVVQEVFERMLTHGAEFRGQARPMTWMYRVTTNAALNALRSRKVREPVLAVVEEQVGLPALEARLQLTRWLACLDARELEVAVLLYVDGLTQQEVADASPRLGLTSVTTLDTMNPEVYRRQSLLADVDGIYQGPDSLYLSQRHWWWVSDANTTDITYVYRFDVSNKDTTLFVAAGHIEGAPLNQFSFDEYRQHLRIATTVSDPKTWETINRVVVLRTEGNALVEAGRSEDLAPGERIMSARFMGDKAYVVTIRQTDPLYVFDLSKPEAPHKVGELKIPGFSSYIHPLDDTHLLTIGSLFGNPWRGGQVQLQIFDISDPTQPKQTHTKLVGNSTGSSAAQWNQKAFNFFSARKLLAIPFSDWYTDDSSQSYFVSDVRVFQADAETGFAEKGALPLADVLKRGDCNDSACWSWWWQPQALRSVMADDFVYAVSSGGVRVSHIDALDKPLATALFPPSP